MTLSNLIKSYRISKNLSQRQFATLCDLSNGYISMLEKEINPKTQEPISPTLSALMKIAKAMGITLTELLTMADDIPVSLSIDDNLTKEEKELLNAWRNASEAAKEAAMLTLKSNKKVIEKKEQAV